MAVSAAVLRPLFVCVVATFGCGRDRTPDVAPSTIELACDDEVRTIEIGDVALDDALCGEPWTAWEIDARGKIELVRNQAGRTLWLRRRGAIAVVEVLANGQVVSTIAGVTRIGFHEPSVPQKVPSITVTKGGMTEQLTMPQLAKRYPGNRSKAIALCPLLDAADTRQTMIVVGNNGTSSGPFDRSSCERDGLILHTNNRGDVQLRDRNRRRILIGVTGVVVGAPDTLK